MLQRLSYVKGKSLATGVLDRHVYRSQDATIGGVCAGFAECFDMDPIVIRILAVLVTLITLGAGVFVYLVLWARLPRNSEPDIPVVIKPESAESSTYGLVDTATGLAEHRRGSRRESTISLLTRMAIALGLTLLFIAIATNLSPYVPGTEWWQFWPIALIITGLCLIVVPIPMRYEAIWHAVGIGVMSCAAMLLPITLDMLSWQTIPYAFSQAWGIFVMGIVTFVYGVYRKIDAIIIASAFFVTALCIYALLVCAIPGGSESLFFISPNGHIYTLFVPGA